MMASSQQRCVFVGNIPYDATEEQLIQICEEVGPVVSFRLVLDRETGKPKGYGFCEYKDEETALSARRNLQGYEINGRQLRVDFAENDKNADRNREQGRGGPGLTSNIDVQKQSGGPVILVDSFLQQPIGLPLAATAASVMAGALGGVQTGSLSQNGLQIQPGMNNDPLTHYLAKMSRAQLHEIMLEFKLMATQNNALARQLLVAAPQLLKALFQAQIMLGMVTPQVLQMPNIRQVSGAMPQPFSQEGKQDRQPTLPLQQGQTPPFPDKMQFGQLPHLPEGMVSKVLPNASISQSSGLPLQNIPLQPLFQLPQQSQAQVVSQTTVPAQSGVPAVSSIRPLAGLSIHPQTPLVASNVVKPQMQAPLLQPPRPVGAANVGFSQLALPNGTFSHSTLARPPLPHATIQPGPSTSSISQDSNWVPRNNAQLNLPLELAENARMMNDASELMNPPKLARLNDGSSISRAVVTGNTATGPSAPTQVSRPSTISAGDASAADNTGANNARPENKTLQLPPEVESALLQQVMSLTSEQLSSLPPEQRQQVLQLQQMLR
eukprot:TRINITY_DN5710_c0_g1_i1.p1 TRINITY_DN5710_c0_g1~~TRINITY_DN5710_c0_g1_i1.p1  ORF type:complete len:550 (-),score=141.94 TRINITY_DN5710_c0_g1_i1:414-2063(-)